MKFINKLSTWQLLLMVAVVAAIIGFGAAFAVSTMNKDEVSEASCADTCVALEADKATPNTVAITKGSYVQFNSADGKAHNLSLGKGGDEHEHTGKFYSGEFKADEGWKVQFNEEGTFNFHDHLNPQINVVVVVYEAGKQYKVE